MGAIVLLILLSFFACVRLDVRMYFFYVLTRLIWLGWFIVWLICVLKAVNGQRFKLPVIGDLAEKQAGS